MATNQYSYPPPPPPPPQHAGPPAGYSPYQPSPYGHNPNPRGGGRGRGRGGNHNQGGRGDFHASSPYNHHAGGYNGPGHLSGGYVQQNPAPYIGPQPPAPANGYPQPMWHEQQQQQQQQQQHIQPPHLQLQHQQAPAPVPLSAQNYHPNYAPQVYQPPQPQQQQQQPQYGPQQPSFQHSQPPNSFAQHAPSSQSLHQVGPPPPQQWQGPPHHTQPPYSGGGRGRGRGGHGQGRGGFEAPLMGPPIRMGFDSDRPVDPLPQASNGYPPPYSNPQHSPSAQFVQPAYQGYPSQNFGHRGGRQSLDPNPFHSQNSYRGRGGMYGNRGKRDQSNVDKMRHRSLKNRHSEDSARRGSVTDLPQKPVEDGTKLGESKKKKKKKRKTNTLGLTPRTEEYEESEEEDDADEEARLAANVENFESLREPSNLAAWLRERRERWPTKARREAKEAELTKRRQLAVEQSSRDKAKAKRDREDKEAADKANKEKYSAAGGESKLERQQRKAEKLRKQLEKAEKKVQDAMKAGTKRKRGDEDGDETMVNGIKIKVEGDIVDQVIAKATARAPDDDSDSSFEDSSEYTSDSGSDDDSGPEEMVSRRTAPAQVHPPKKAILQRQCKYFSTGGTCGKKGKCRFVHDQSVRDAALREKELNGGRMTLSQRLMQNDKEKDDLMVLKSITYLYEKGMLDEPYAEGESYADSHRTELVLPPHPHHSQQTFDERQNGVRFYDDTQGHSEQDFMDSEV